MARFPPETDLSLHDVIDILESVLREEEIDNAPAAKVWIKSTLPELRRAEEKCASISTNRVIVKILEAMVLIERKYGKNHNLSSHDDRLDLS